MTILSEAFLSDAAARLRGSVVGIVDDSRGASRGGHGAGIAWGPPSGNLFVTSAHVVSGHKVTVLTPDGRAAPGDVIARDATRDIAVVHAAGAAVPAVTTRDPYTLRAGSLVFAVGHPFGVREAISVGMLQAVRALPEGYALERNGRRRSPRPSLAWVQADLRLAPGNSGGPIADVEGNVIGVAAMIVSGLALAVPAPDVDQLLSSLG